MIHKGSRPTFLGAQLALPWPGSDHLTIAGRAEADFEGAEGAPLSYGSREPLETTCQHDSSARLRIVIEAPSIGRVALGEPTAAPMWTQRLVAFKLSIGRLFQATPTGAPLFRLLAPAH